MSFAPGRPTLAMLVALMALQVGSARTAGAQSPSRNPVAAQALYDDGRRLVQAGRFDEACPKLKESYQLDPAGGTMLNLADCYEKQGKTALAWSTFKDALARAQRDNREDRIDFANQHLAALERRLARLTVEVKPEARRAGVAVTVDGVPLGEAAWGVAMPIDPGKHLVRAEAPGKQPFVASVDAPMTAVLQRVEVPALGDAQGLAHGANAVGDARADTGPAPAGRGASSSRHTIGWVLGGLGVVSLGAASYFGLHAFARWSDRDAACVGGCSDDAKRAGDDATQAATLSTVGFAGGLLLVAGGAYLAFSGHDEATGTAASGSRVELTPLAFAQGAGLAVRSVW